MNDNFNDLMRKVEIISQDVIDIMKENRKMLEEVLQTLKEINDKR